MRQPENGRTRYIALETGLLQAAIVRKYIERTTIPMPDPDQPDQNYRERIAEREDLINYCKTFETMHDNGKLMWWGYRHNDGTTHLKRYLSKEDIDEASDSDFVNMLITPFEAENREEALKILATRLP